MPVWMVSGLARLANFKIQLSRTSSRNVHLFEAYPRTQKADAKPSRRQSYDGRRFFARVIVRHADSLETDRGKKAKEAAAQEASFANGTPVDDSSVDLLSTSSLISEIGTIDEVDDVSPEVADPADTTVSSANAPLQSVTSPVKYHQRELDAYPEAEMAFVEALDALEMGMGSDIKSW